MISTRSRIGAGPGATGSLGDVCYHGRVLGGVAHGVSFKTAGLSIGNCGRYCLLAAMQIGIRPVIAFMTNAVGFTGVPSPCMVYAT